MSKIAIAGATTGTGTFTLASPATNTDRVLTLPDEAGTVDTLQRAGNVLQVVQGTTSTLVTVASTTYADSGLSASITPTSANSKILVIVQQVCSTLRPSALDAGVVKLRLLRGDTSVYEINQAVVGFNFGAYPVEIGSSVSLAYLDAPSTISATTYKTQGAGVYVSNTAYLNGTTQGGSSSTITLMEIAA